MLLAHNGVSHQQKETGDTENKSQVQGKETEKPLQNTDVQTNVVESQSNQKVEKVETQTEVKPNTQTTTVQKAAISNESLASKFIPGWGESVFILLVISPFLLLGIKRWLHK